MHQIGFIIVKSTVRCPMYSASFFKTLYSSSNKTNARIAYDKIKATEKWVQHSIYLHIMQKLLLNSNREDRYTLLAAIKAAESKVNYYYKHKNYNVNQASTLFSQAKRMLRKM